MGSHVQWLSVSVNQAQSPGLYAVQVAGTEIGLKQQDLRTLGIGPASSKLPQGEWVKLSDIPGISATFDALNQQLFLSARMAALSRRQYLENQPHDVQPGMPTTDTRLGHLTLGYSLNATHSTGYQYACAQTSLTSSGWLPGTLYSSFNSRVAENPQETQDRTTRLMTAWQLDDSQHQISLTLGDAITSGVSWSRQVRFGGIHLARNFQLTPQLNTSPRAEYSSTAVLPSTVDLYIDGLKQSSQQVVPGQYILATQPTFTGNGQADIVITDINGQRKVVSLDLYGAPQMLAAGLSSGTLDVGWMRQNYSLNSNDYAAKPMLDAGWRYGVNNTLTLALHTEQQRAARNAGVGAYWLPSPWVGVLSAHIAVSHSLTAPGKQWGVGWQWNGRGYAFSASTTLRENTFTDIASTSGAVPARRSDAVWASTRLGPLGQLGMGWVRQHTAGNDEQYLNASWSKTFSHGVNTNITWTRDIAGRDSQINFTLAVPFGFHDQVSVQSSGSRQQWRYRHQADNDQGGWSWDAGQSNGYQQYHYADVGNLNRYGEWHLGINKAETETSGWLTGEGSLTLLRGHIYAMRQSHQGVALVSSNGIPSVPVYQENRLAGRTDDKGWLLLTELPGYHTSKISIDPLKLPASVLTPVTERYISPGTGQVVLVDFGMKEALSVVARLVDAHGAPLPLGSQVRIKGDSTTKSVARDGMIWLENPTLPAELEVTTNQHRCHARLPARPAGQAYLQPGNILCQ
ncbi:fimbria/pilus outer membrane usher protein [Mangrovibacter phragmitis]|uniref:fimbria/pilus outer membrane usher protein n=1 Tax=Mangrovibacter phragmitis TaxID=1691903 RepID=UPI00351246C1